jgi:hypothetical protein
MGAFVTATAMVFCGCGEATATIEKTVRVRGVLVHRGSPLGYYQVMFHPEDGRRPAAGVSDEQGRFVLGTNGAGDGAVVGKHRVSIVYIGPPSATRDGMIDFSPPPPPKIKIATKYSQPDTSGITREVPASGASDLKIDLP